MRFSSNLHLFLLLKVLFIISFSCNHTDSTKGENRKTDDKSKQEDCCVYSSAKVDTLTDNWLEFETNNFNNIRNLLQFNSSGGSSRITAKAISFELDTNHKSHLLEELSLLSKDSLRSAIFRIQFGLKTSSLGTTIQNGPNLELIPILDVVDTTSRNIINDKYYPLIFSEENLIAKACSYKRVVEEEKKITCKDSRPYLNSWEKLPIDKIPDAMSAKDSAGDRLLLKYLTFKNDNPAEEIYDELQANDKSLFFHLGNDSTVNINDRVSLTGILHIDYSSLASENLDPQTQSDPPLFNFASACPCYCGGQNVCP